MKHSAILFLLTGFILVTVADSILVAQINGPDGNQFPPDLRNFNSFQRHSDRVRSSSADFEPQRGRPWFQPKTPLSTHGMTEESKLFDPSIDQLDPISRLRHGGPHTRTMDPAREPGRSVFQNYSRRTETLMDTVQEAWVRHYASGLAASDEYQRAMVIDGSGNVYVTGASSATFTGLDYATVKYNTAGVEQWAARYNGPGNYADWAFGLAVDDSGNVYVTGGSYGSGTSADYATVKYNASGVQQWVVRYNGPGNDADWAFALAVDDSANVYVTGYSYSGTSSDYATIKYNASGVEQWVVRYDGPVDSIDEAHALAVDDSGNVYVTGWSSGSGTSYDYATIKYNAAGIQMWVTRYDGPGNSTDRAAALVVGDSGNVYVTGHSFASGTDYDYATIKYDASGNEVWVRRYNGPANDDDRALAIAVDASNDVYVTGGVNYGSGAYYDYSTIKYNAAGVEQWVARYNGPENSTDIAFGVAVDRSGGVYVTGYSFASSTLADYATVKYNTAGVVLWVVRYNGSANDYDLASALAVDDSGNVYVTGESVDSVTYYDYTTVKYNSAGVQQWVARYNGPGTSKEEAIALAVDDSGNVYVTGWSYGSGTSFDYATVKYNAAGVQEWVARYNGPGNFDDYGYDLAVDGSGNVYVTGESAGSGTGLDCVTIKYDASGNEVWVRRYNGPGNSDDWGNALAVDGSGNVYVTGGSYGSGTSFDYATVKYNAAGVQEWVALYSGLGNFDDYGYALTVDGSGNVYVTGSSTGSGTALDYGTIKYNANGVEQWVALYNGPGNSYDEAYAIAVDDSGNVYVTGVYQYDSYYTSRDYSTLKYSREGVERWVAHYNGPGNGYDFARALAVDGSGNVYVTGSSEGSGTSDDYATIKYSPEGVEWWVARYNGPGNNFDNATALAVDSSGNVYVTGSIYQGLLDIDYGTIKYNAAGVQQWVASYNGPGNGYDFARALAVDGSGNVYVTGTSTENDALFSTWSVYTTIKYSQIPTAVDEPRSGVPEKFLLEQNYPNPFNPGTVIGFHLPLSSLVRLKVYNVLGQEVATLVNEMKSPGRYEITWNADNYPSGVYFYQLQAGSFGQTRKLVLLK